MVPAETGRISRSGGLVLLGGRAVAEVLDDAGQDGDEDNGQDHEGEVAPHHGDVPEEEAAEGVGRTSRPGWRSRNQQVIPDEGIVRGPKV